MLNLYIAPRSRKARVPEPETIEAALAFLADLGIVGSGSATELPPGREVARFFNNDAHDDLLPAELTFDALRIEHSARARFLPLNQPIEAYPEPNCRVCDDALDTQQLSEALNAIALLPLERFDCVCPSCRTELTLADIDFGQPVATARFWFLVEGAGTSRLNPAVVDRIGKLFGMPVVVVPEVPAEDVNEWAPARQMLRRR